MRTSSTAAGFAKPANTKTIVAAFKCLPVNRPDATYRRPVMLMYEFDYVFDRCGELDVFDGRLLHVEGDDPDAWELGNLTFDWICQDYDRSALMLASVSEELYAKERR